MLSEFGGYSYGVPGHIPDKSFGYRQYHDQKKYQEAVLKLYEWDLQVPRILSATAHYTQLNDADEINGLDAFDRQVVKWDPEDLKKMNEKLIKGD